MADFPAMPLWTDALIGDTTHLTTLEFGAYMKLLICAWRTSTCDLPRSDKMIARYTGLKPAQWNSMKDIILPFFTMRYRHGEYRLFQKRLRKERAYVLKRSRLQKLRRKGRSLKNKETAPTVVLPGPNQPTPTPTPIKKEERDTTVSLVPSVPDENRSRKKYPDEFESFWKAYPKRPTDTKALAFKAWTKARKTLSAEDLRMAAVNYAGFCICQGHEPMLVQTWVNREGWTASYARDGPKLPARGNQRPGKVDEIMQARMERERRRNDRVATD